MARRVASRKLQWITAVGSGRVSFFNKYTVEMALVGDRRAAASSKPGGALECITSYGQRPPPRSCARCSITPASDRRIRGLHDRVRHFRKAGLGPARRRRGREGRFALCHRRRQRHYLARQPSEGRVQQLTGSGSSAAGADEHPRATDRRAQAMTIKAINPATGEAFASYQEMTDDRLRDAISKAHNAFLDWRRTGFSSRTGLMRQAAKVLRENAGKYADLMAREMGKPIRDGVAEVQKCAAACDYYADNAERFLAAEPIKTEACKSYVIFQPLGVVLAVMPWNFPFWQVFRFAAPGLMAGNGAVMKHASNVPGCALAIEQVFIEAGFPKDLFRTLLIPSASVNALIEDEAIAAVTLTGSVPAGQKVAEAAGRNLKKCVLELGGSDAHVVLEDADVKKAAEV